MCSKVAQKLFPKNISKLKKDEAQRQAPAPSELARVCSITRRQKRRISEIKYPPLYTQMSESFLEFGSSV